MHLLAIMKGRAAVQRVYPRLLLQSTRTTWLLSHTPTRLEAVAEQSDLISPVNLAIPVSRTSSSQSSASIISQYRKLPPGPYGPFKEPQQNNQYSALNSMHSLPKQPEHTTSTRQIHQPSLPGSNSLASHTSPSDRYANTAGIPSPTSSTVYLGSLQPPILEAASSGNLSSHSSNSKPVSPASTKTKQRTRVPKSWQNQPIRVQVLLLQPKIVYSTTKLAIWLHKIWDRTNMKVAMPDMSKSFLIIRYNHVNKCYDQSLWEASTSPWSRQSLGPDVQVQYRQ